MPSDGISSLGLWTGELKSVVWKYFRFIKKLTKHITYIHKMAIVKLAIYTITERFMHLEHIKT